jgi:hypothetical protein
MSVFAPLYYAGGRYAAMTDRKMLSAMIGSDISTTDSDKISGVLYGGTSANSPLLASYSSKGNLSVSVGFCVVPDTAYVTSTSNITIGTGSKTFTVTTRENLSLGLEVKVSNSSTNYMIGKITDISFTSITVDVTSVGGSGSFTSWQITKTIQDGLYVGGITAAETITYSSAVSTRQDTLYAVIDTTPYIITHRVLGTNGSAGGNNASASNTVKLTTSVAHGFKVGQTVVVSGINDIFDGSYLITDVPTTTTFEYADTNADITYAAVVPSAQFGVNIYTVTDKAYDNSTGVVTLTTSASHSRSAGDIITVKGVGREFDGTYTLITGTTGSTLTYYQNRIFPNVTSVAISQSTAATAQVPFKLVIDEGDAGTFASKAKIKLATGVINTGATADVWTDARRFSVIGGGVEHILSTSPNLTDSPGRFRFNASTNSLQYYTTSWTNFLATGTTGTTASVASHTHSGLSAVSHTHSFAATSHTHVVGDVAGLGGSAALYYSNLPNAISNGALSTSETGVYVLGTVQLAQVSLNSAVPMYVLLQYQGIRYGGTTNSSSHSLRVDITGDANIDEYTNSGTASNETAATDGTAYNIGDYASGEDSTWVGKIIGSRLVKVPAGNITYTLNASSTGPYSGGIFPEMYISGATLRVIPIAQA